MPYRFLSNPARRACLRGFLACVLAVSACATPAQAQDSRDPVYVFHTNLGDMNVQLFPDIAPQTVANFLNYVNSGAYNDTFIQRSVSNFVLQGGGYTVDANANVSAIAVNAAIANEFDLSNTRGTIAMAKVGNNPNSATSQWFFNEQDNSSNLNSQNGGFTVFGRVADSASLAVMDAIGAEPIYDASQHYNNADFTSLPLVGYQNTSVIPQSNFVLVSSIIPVSSRWAAAAVAVGGDNLSRILWSNVDGRSSVWTIGAGNNVTSSPILAPGGTWSTQDISLDTQNYTHVLWNNSDGRMTVWTLKGTTITSLPIFQPGGGWTAQALSMDKIGNAHVLWVNPDGRMAVWSITPQGQASSSPLYQPGGGWSARSLSEDAQARAHVLWTNTDGRMSVWTLGPGSGVTSTSIYNPGSGWGARKVSVDSAGNNRVLWFNGDGRMSVWTIGGGNAVTSTSIYNPGGGWGAQGLSVDAQGSSRVLWGNGDGRTAVWTMPAQGSVTSTPIYQP